MIEALNQAKQEALQQNQETGIPLASLEFFPHGVDKVIPQFRHKGLLYEENCFIQLNQHLTHGFAVGPHIIDDMFCNRGHNTQSLTRPDALWLDHSQNNQMILRTFYEFKSGFITSRNAKSKLKDKSKGLSRLTEKFRNEPQLLPSMLQSVVGNSFDVPDRIHIPDNVEVVFYTPNLQGPVDGIPAATYLNFPAPNINN